MSTKSSSHFGLRIHRPAHSDAPSVHIFLEGLVRLANGMLSVTPVCSSLEEMEGHIERLKEELDEILRKTRHAFRESEGASAGV